MYFQVYSRRKQCRAHCPTGHIVMFSSSKILIKLIAVILLCSLPKLTNSWTFVDTATKANFPLGLAHLEITRRNNLSSRCTGVVIANHTVLTAAHCIDDFPSKITIDLNRAGPFNNLKCAEYKFWNPRKKQCIRRKVVNYKVNRYFRENGLDDYFYDKIPKSVALMSKDIRQHPKYLSVKNDFMKNPAERWLENDIAILSVKKGFFSSEARSTMYKSTFRINQDSEIPSTDREKWPYGYLLGSGYGKFKPLNYQEVIKEKNILEKFKKMYFDDPATYQKAKRDYFFNQVRARTGHSSIISNNRLRREMLMETDYDLVMNIDRGIFIENLLGYNNKSQVVDFPKEYLASVGYYTKNNPFREQYQNQKSHALLPTIKPTMCYGDSGGPMWQWFLIPKKESESSADVDDIKKDNLEKTSPNNNNNLFSIVGQYPLEQSSKIDSGEDESEKSKEIDTSKNYERVPYLFGIMSLMDDDCQQFMISVRVSEHLDFIRRSCRYKSDRRFIFGDLNNNF